MGFTYFFLGFLVLCLLARLGGAGVLHLADYFVGAIWPDRQRLPHPWISLALFGAALWVVWLPFLVVVGFLALAENCHQDQEAL